MTKKKENHLLRNVIAGAVTAVGAGVMAAKVLSDKESKENIENKMKKVEKNGEKVLSNMNDTKDEVIKKIIQEFEDLKVRVKKGKEATDLQKEINSITDIIEKIKQSNKNDFSKLLEQVKLSIEKLRQDYEKTAK